MKISIDMEAIFAPISGENPAGEDLRYTSVYDDIREARRAEDPTSQGEWVREAKTSDWRNVISISLDALSQKSKDLQIAAWLAEALTMTEGFDGISSGMMVLSGLLERFWDTVYPQIEDEDHDYRAAPFEFLNDKLSFSVRQIPLTDPKATKGYSYLNWRESRDVANARGEDRERMLADGRILAEEVDSAIAKSSVVFYKSLANSLSYSLETFRTLDPLVDEKFQSHAPRISGLGQALEDCHRLVVKICREQKGLSEAVEAASDNTGAQESAGDFVVEAAVGYGGESYGPGSGFSSEPFLMPTVAGTADQQETQIWNEALKAMQSGGFKDALNLLLASASSQSSERGRSRYRFLVAKLCIKAGHPDLARPIVEQLNTMITELQLENWESPYWISEILEALYQCLMSGEGSDEDASRANELFRKICTLDVTKALGSRK